MAPTKKEVIIPKNTGLESVELLESPRAGRVLARWIWGIGMFLFLALFLPWQQNIQATGEVTALSPENRPQTVQSAIPGRIDRWYVQEGDYVQQGDTILSIEEIQDDYFDPDLLERLGDQVAAQEAAIASRRDNAAALERQIYALRQGLLLALQQAKNSVRQTELQRISDSLASVAARNNYGITVNQLERTRVLYDNGNVSLTAMQEREQEQQQAMAMLGARENQFLATQNELINAKIELNAVEARYLESISSAESSLNATRASIHDGGTQPSTVAQ